MDAQERAAFEDETEELRRDLAERQERRASGLEPPQWQAPEPPPLVTRDTTGADAVVAQPPRQPTGPSNKVLWDAMTALAKEAGDAVGKLDKKLEKLHARIGGTDLGDVRAKIEGLCQSHARMEALIAKESKARTESAQAQLSRLLTSKEERESQLIALDRRLLDTEKELAALRRQIEGR